MCRTSQNVYLTTFVCLLLGHFFLALARFSLKFGSWWARAQGAGQRIDLSYLWGFLYVVTHFIKFSPGFKRAIFYQVFCMRCCICDAFHEVSAMGGVPRTCCVVFFLYGGSKGAVLEEVFTVGVPIFCILRSFLGRGAGWAGGGGG